MVRDVPLSSNSLMILTYQIDKPSKCIGQFPFPFGEWSASLKAVDGNGYSIGQIKSHDWGRDNCVESTNFCYLPFALSPIYGEYYLEEPRKIHPNAITTTTVRMSALRGNLSVGWTFAKNGEAGRPPSLWRMSIRVICWKEDQIPCKSENHSATGGHDADYSKDQADQR